MENNLRQIERLISSGIQQEKVNIMAKFLKDSELNSAIEKLIDAAEEHVLLVSPYIKLHTRIRDKLSLRKKEVHLIVVFGKHEDGKDSTIHPNDYEFFKTFDTVEIKHEKNLHAKYYASEKEAILTSMNLYDFSQNTNYEFGIQLKSGSYSDIAKGFLGFGDSKLDNDAGEFFFRIYEGAEDVFIKEPITKKEGLIWKTEILVDSKVIVDNTEKFFKSSKPTVQLKSPSTPDKPKTQTGYCIRTKAQIPFNPKRPFSDTAFESWNKFKNPDFAEKYCHFSGEPSNGETSFSKPILKKNWSKAKEVFGF
jgi:phosphatidylserine/phosphatidylglycerophosphate/cardiolipin synthase-like enzyme